MPCKAVLKLLVVNLPVVESSNAAIVIATVGAIRPRPTYTPNGTTPSHRRAPWSARGDPAGPGPGGQRLRGHGLGRATRHQPPTCVGQFWVTTVSAAAACAALGNVSVPDGAGGSAAYAVLFTVPLATSVDSSIGRV